MCLSLLLERISSTMWRQIYETNVAYLNHSIENADVAFVKGANERNEFFEKNEQTVIII